MIEPNRDATGRRPLRTTAERAAFGAAVRYARSTGLETPAEAAYLAALADARREICHRFVRGLLRGDPAGLPDPAFVDRESMTTSTASRPTVPDEPDPLSNLDEERLRSIGERVPTACRRIALLAFPRSETVLVAPIERRHGYDRFRPIGEIRRWKPTDGTVAIDHPVDLVPPLECEGAFVDSEQAERVRTEVAESVANLALARLAKANQARAVDGRDGQPALERIPAEISAADAAGAFERIVTDGHPFHPGGKIRRGMTPAEGLAYAPEFTDRVDLRFVAIDREDALETRTDADADRLTDRLYATFDGLEGALERALPDGRRPAEYATVPVHPLQFHRTVPDRYAAAIAADRVVPIRDYAAPATPQLNLRSVIPFETERTAENPPRLKLAIPVQTTNVVRTLSPHAVANGPQVTAVVRTIAERDALESMGVLAEPAATCYDPPGGPHPDGDGFDDARHLSGLLRANPAANSLVSDGEVPVVASSLVADAPTTGRPLVCELVEGYATRAGISDVEDAASRFLERYAAVVVPDHLRLLCAYGIALESHLQNSLLVFDTETATPVATLVRDLGGIRVHGDRLADRGLSIDPYPDSDLDADGAGDLHRKLYYALFQNHLAELVATISHHLAIDEQACWVRIREQCERAFESIRADGAVPAERIRRDERALFDDPTTHKALTAMRLRGKRHEYVTSDVSNPLAASGRRRIDAAD